MASLALHRGAWSLQISRTSSRFTVSFSTALPRRHRSPASRSTTSSLHSSRTHRSTHPRPFSTSPSPYQDSPAASTSTTPKPPSQDPATLTGGFNDTPLILDEGTRQVDWSRSFHGLSTEAFSKKAADILLAPIEASDVEIKPDGIIYLPEIKYRRILNRAFGPGGWGLAPRGETIVTAKAVTREYALVALGRLVSVARGEQDYFSQEGIPTAAEGCKSNALLRCCKDLGVASELWDPRFIRRFVKENAKEVWVEHVVTKKKKKIYLRKEDSPVYPFKETKSTAGAF